MQGAQPESMEGEAADEEAEESEEEGAAAEGDEKPGRPAGSARKSRRPTTASRYKPFATQFDEVVEAEDLCDPEELTRLRQQLDQQLQHLQGVVSKLANRLQRRLAWRSSSAPGSSTWRRASSTSRGSRASSRTRPSRSPTSASARPISATPS
jgi:cobalamin biosynthesis protein CobT